MREKSPWAFWGLVLSLGTLLLVPSGLLLKALERYRRLVEGAEFPLRPLPWRGLPHGAGRAASPGRAGSVEALEFAEFRLHAPKARAVHLVGDFNAWRAGTLSMARKAKGDWELILPLPRGRYRYLFLVDGEARLDPRNGEAEESEGRRASVREVR